MKISFDLSNKIANMSFVCAILVVCHHFAVPDAVGSFLWWVGSLFGQGDMAYGGGLSHVAVPWFFVVSGFFLAGHMGEDGWWKRETLKRVRSLLVPFFFWTITGILLLTLMDLSQGRRPFFASVKTIAFGVGFYPYAVINPMASQLWYVRALFVLVLVSPIIYRFIGWTWMVFVFAVYTIVAPFDGGVMHPVFRYGLSLEGLFYFSLGALLRLRPIKINLGLIGCLSLAVGLFLLFTQASLLLCDVQTSYYLKWVSTPFLMFGLFAIMPSTKWPIWLVSASFPIYLMHRIFLWPFYGLSRAMDWGGASVGWWSAQLLVGAGLPIVAAFLLRRLFPGVAMMVFGGR